MNILIVYATVEGQTRKIAEFLKAEANKAGHKITLCDATNAPMGPKGYDIALIGASVHMEKYQTSIQHYVHKHSGILNRMHSAFLSVSLAAASGDEESLAELRGATSDFLEQTGWRPAMVEYVAGALLYTNYDFLKKMIIRLIAKNKGLSTTQDVEYTDWQELIVFLKKLIDTWTAAPVTVASDVTDDAAIS